jgi:hypothetical protein
MAQDVTPWLTEIRTLQRQLSDARQDCEAAYASAANWRQLYETEAQQRRLEVEQSQDRIQQLSAQVQALQAASLPTGSAGATAPSAAEGHTPDNLDPATLAELSPSGDIPTDVAQLQAQFKTLLDRCQTLHQALNAEKLAHSRTRQSLTTALGDTIDMLAKAQPDTAASLKASLGVPNK